MDFLEIKEIKSDKVKAVSRMFTYILVFESVCKYSLKILVALKFPVTQN